MPTFYEFFAGGGMARLGLGPDWACLFANDFDSKKANVYRQNFGSCDFREGDIRDVTVDELPGYADLAWASFPCQDLSLAGHGRGLSGQRSGTFWPFWKLMQSLVRRERGPRLIVLENVCGALTSNGGRDFAELGRAIRDLGYTFGAIVVDAVHFLPQSRPRLFVIATKPSTSFPRHVLRSDPNLFWHPRNLVEAKFHLPKNVQDSWIWWDLPHPSPRAVKFADLIDDVPSGVGWHSETATQHLLDMMSPGNRHKVNQVVATNLRKVGSLYRRTRNGSQRAEVRFDDVAGCLRTPAGGSSRQTIIVVEGGAIRSRLLSPREAARLMGLPPSYRLPVNYNDAYHLAGDGVVVPVVSFLNSNVLQPLVSANQRHSRATA